MPVSAALAQTLDQQLAYALNQLHGCAASIADSKARYKATGDARYLTAIQNVRPLYDNWREQYNAVARQLGAQELPDRWEMVLLNVSDSVAAPLDQIITAAGNVAEGAGNVAKHADYLVGGILVVVGLGLVAYLWRGLGDVTSVIKAVK